MPLSRFKFTKEVTTCDECGEALVIPPGVYYRGRKMHKQEAAQRRRRDLTHEQLSPMWAETESALRELLPE